MLDVNRPTQPSPASATLTGRELMRRDLARLFRWYLPLVAPAVASLAEYRPRVRVGPLAFSVPLGRLFARPLADAIAASTRDNTLADALAELFAGAFDDRQLALGSAAVATELAAWNQAADPLTDGQWRTVGQAFGLDEPLGLESRVTELVSTWPQEVDLIALARGELPRGGPSDAAADPH